MSHHTSYEMKPRESIWASRPGYKPVLMLVALVVFVGLVMVPPPQSMIALVGKADPGGYKQEFLSLINKAQNLMEANRPD